MSSRPEPDGPREKKNVWSFPAKMSLIYAMVTILGMGGLSVALWYALDDSLDAEWEAELSAVKACWRDNTDMTEAQVEAAVIKLEGTSRITLGPSTDALFTRTFLWLSIPTVLFGLIVGYLFMLRASRPIVRLQDTVSGILETGEMGRRVPEGRSGPMVYELILLFNRMLARIEALVRGMHDALDNVAHDLRTPLTRLRAVAERGLQKPEGAEAQSEALADCMEESEQVLTMLTTLMDVAEAESGTMRLRLEAVDVSALLGGVAELYEMVAEDKEVVLETDLPAALDVEADPSRLRQVLANLVDNAVKYTRPGGTVVVSARAEGADAVLRVKDDGMGIPPGDLPRIWDRLYRADRSRSEHGLGLGLSFVRAIVEAHGGTATVESIVNQGSTFAVRLPLASPGEADA